MVRDGEALAIIDQESLRSWVWNGASIAELHDADPADRIARVVEIVRTVSE